MLTYALKRFGLALAVGFTISLLAFVLLNVAADPAVVIAGEEATSEEIAEIRRQYGFDRPLAVRYLAWLGGVLQGDFGQSVYWRTPVFELVARHFPVTLILAGLSFSVTILVAIPLGVAAALRPNSLVDRAALSLAVAAQAIPNFWLGMMAILLLAVIWPIFPVSGNDTIWHFILPAVVLGLSSVPSVMRLTRTGLLEVMGSDYIRTARAKGYRGIGLLRRHAMRNALLPVVSVLAVQFGDKLGGAIVTETVFAINGIGRLAVESILAGDVPTVQMLLFLFAMFFVMANLAADLLNAWIDPRMRLG
ncbi:ABC transporter permease [Thalassococcus sp. S3]|uniref:ABC transporter permease n=1 Tax=Thalassococcus sp. S3 TaxID=2017482 RepID=UPI0010242F6E|nr:ABC transporter permease [Thalassococcus sp. S3]QBF30531.1 ABC transporter permease [Thalassococcus sp. S3]